MANETDMHDFWSYEYGDRDMNQLCQALCWQDANRFGTVVSTPASAIDAYYASNIQGSGVGPYGSFTYYDIGSYGHVDWVMNSGNSNMATSHVAENWGWTNRGWQNAWTYASITGASILGWAWDNGGNTIPTDGSSGGTTDYGYGLTTECQAALQSAMQSQVPSRYDGPVDGVFGEASVSGMQQWLKDLGYLPADYVVDGIPGPTYGQALQELARDRGVPPYTGPIDGAPGENTSVSLIGWAATTIPAPPDPTPDPVIPTTPAGTFFAVDVATTQETFDFAGYKAAGGQGALIKMGGGNAFDSPYIAPAYATQLAGARAAGLLVGHYWFNGAMNGLTPESSADYYAQNIDLYEGDIIALDVEDETDTGTKAYTSEEAHAFAKRLVENLGEGLHLGVYGNDTVWASGDWSWIEEEGHWRWPADWGANDGNVGTAPAEPWAIWQYTSVAGPIPGWADDSLDGNAVKTDTWSTYGYLEEEPPDPEPGDGSDDELRALMGDFFDDFATLAGEYRDKVDNLPDDDDDDDETSGRHRLGPLG